MRPRAREAGTSLQHLFEGAGGPAGSVEDLAPGEPNRLGRAHGGGVEVTGGDFERARSLITEGIDIDYRGASGDVDLDARGDVRSATYGIWEVRGGAFVQIETRSFGP